MPESRRLLAVPFIGKDVPSPAAEFANPEVLVGLTILAYRYDGLRDSDVSQLVASLKDRLKQETGPFKDRPSRALFQDWIDAATLAKPLMVGDEPLPPTRPTPFPPPPSPPPAAHLP